MRCSRACSLLLLLHLAALLAVGHEELSASGSVLFAEKGQIFLFVCPASFCKVGLFLHLSDQCITSVPVLFQPAGQFQPDSDLSIVHPVKTTADGGFISHSVSHHFKGGRFRRDLQPAGLEGQVYYRVNYKGRSLTFNLTINHHLISSNFILEKRNGGANRTEQPFSEGNSCHLVGTVEASDLGRGTAAVSTCGGLVRGQASCTTTKQLV